MKLNPIHHNPELLEQIDEYYQDAYNMYDSYYYDSIWGDNTDYVEADWIQYHWLTTLDRTVVGDAIYNLDGCNVYKEGDEILDYEIYSYSSTNKTVGFFGMLMTAYKGTDKPSTKLLKLHNIMIERYPELYIKLLDVI